VGVAGATGRHDLGRTPIAEIATVEVFEAAPGAWIEVASSGSLIWTTYRDSQGNLVVELPNARPAASLVNRDFAAGLVSSIRIDTAGTAGRPLTRLVVAAREDAEHRIETRGTSLRIDLVPTGQERSRGADRAPPTGLAARRRPPPRRRAATARRSRRGTVTAWSRAARRAPAPRRDQSQLRLRVRIVATASSPTRPSGSRIRNGSSSISTASSTTPIAARSRSTKKS
jgi:hypothetical protein